MSSEMCKSDRPNYKQAYVIETALNVTALT
jgi:hypothetical protein